MNSVQEQRKKTAGAVSIDNILKRRWICLLVILALLGGVCSQLKHIRQAADPLAALFPSGHPHLDTIKELNRLAPQPNTLVAILEVRQGDIFTVETIKKIDDVTKALKKLPDVIPQAAVSLTSRNLVHVDYAADGMEPGAIIGETLPETEEAIAALRRRVAVNGMANGIYVADDKTAAMFTISFENRNNLIKQEYKELDDNKKEATSLKLYKAEKEKEFQANLLNAIQEIKTKEEDANHTLFFMGGELMKAHMTKMGAQLGTAFLGMLILIVVCLAFYFRSVQGVVIPFVAMQFTLLWGMGLFGWFIREFQPMILLAPLFLAMFPLIFSILIMDRYKRTYHRYDDKNAAIVAVYGEFPLGLWAVLSGSAVAGLCFSGVPLLTQLGYLGLLWVAGTFFCIMVIVPVLISFFRPPASRERADRIDFTSKMAGFFPGKGKIPVLAVVLGCILVGGVFSLNRLPVGKNVPGSSYIPENHPWNRCFNIFSEKFVGPYELSIHIQAKEEGGLKDAQVLNEIGDFCSYLNTEGGAKKSVSITQIIKMSQAALMEGYPKWQTVPGQSDNIARSVVMLLTNPGMKKYMDSTWSEATLSTWPGKTDSRSIDAFISKVQQYISEHPSEKFSIKLGSGLAGQTKALNDGVQKAYPVTAAAALFIVFLTGAAVTRSTRMALFTVIPIAIAQCLIFIVMALFNIPVSLSIVPSCAVSVGLGMALAYPMLLSVRAQSGQNGETDYVRIIVFAGVFLSLILLPWSLIQMKFQGNMALMLWIAVLIETVSLIILSPLLIKVVSAKGSL